MPGSSRYRQKPLPMWAAVLFGLLFVALGGFFTFVLVVVERSPSAPPLALLLGFVSALGLLAFGVWIVVSVLRAPRP